MICCRRRGRFYCEVQYPWNKAGYFRTIGFCMDQTQATIIAAISRSVIPIEEALAETADDDYRLVRVASFAECAAMLRKERAAAVILDLALDDLPGPEGIKELERLCPEAVFFFCGNSPLARGEAIESCRRECDYFFANAVSAETLRSMIVYALECKAKLRGLREENLRYACVIGTIDDHISMMDRDYNIVWANDVIKNDFGADIIGKKCYEVFHRRDQACEDCAVRDAFQDGGRHEQIKDDIVSRDGRKRYFWCTAAPARYDREGKPDLVLEIYRDVTQEKMAEHCLRERQQRLELAVFGGNLGTWDWEYKTGELRINKQWAEMLGYTTAEIKPHLSLWKHLVHPDDLPKTLRILNRHIKGETDFYEAEFRMKRKSGEWMWILARGKVIERDGEGKPLRVCGTHLDVDESRKTAEKLKKSEREKNLILENIAETVNYNDRNMVVQWINPRGCQMAGLTQEETIGRHCYEIWCKRDSPCPDCPAKKSMESGKQETRDRRTPDGKTWLVTGMPVRDDKNEIIGAIETAIDITERKRVEDDLKRQTEIAREMARKAEEASRVKSDFLTNMSHEIRTPMTAILGYADILLEEPCQDGESPGRIEALKSIQRNGKHLLCVINSILDLSKIEAGIMEVECTACSPQKLLAEVYSLMQVRAAEKNIALECKSAADVPQMICTDPLRLKQILNILVENAIKFCEAGSVRVEAAMLHSEGKCPQIRFDVIDTGIGMNQCQIEKLFHPFTQADCSSTRRFGGTGLGLTISRRLARLLGGDIAVSSVPGAGSVFSVTIDAGPIDIASALQKGEAAQAEETPQARTGDFKLTGRILLAEDGPDNQRLISYMLTKAGAEVEIAENGKIALEKALAAGDRGTPYDLILLDMQMPVMDGYTAAAALRNAEYHCPIIALTADAMEGSEERCRKAGCIAYVKKPINWNDLLSAVETHMSARELSGVS